MGRVFVGKTGEEVNRHYLPIAGLRRESVTVTNAISCLPVSSGGKLDPKSAKDQQLLMSCAAHHLYPLIDRMRPKLIVAMGNFACQALDPNINLELQHGLPVQTTFGAVYPMYHPATGLHEPKRMLHIRNDWIRLKSHLAGTFTPPVDEYPDPDYQEVEDESEFLYLDPERILAADTETTGRREPFCLTYTQFPGSGRLVRAERVDLLRALQSKLQAWRAPILFHNWLFDRPVTRAMGLQIPDRLVMDTMALVFHLGNLPQGLKALAYRELGMTMQDFDDLVTPHSSARVLDYYRKMDEWEWPRPDEQLIIEKGKFKLYRPQSLSTKLKRFFTDYSKNPDKDVFTMWEDNWEEHQAEIETECGEWPGKDIQHAPFAEVLHYACRDSDALLRLYPKLVQMRQRVRKFPQEKWRVA